MPRYPSAVRPAQARCKWVNHSSPLPPESPNSSTAHVVRQFVEFLELVRLAGYHYTLIDGSLLGAIRHHGLIPGDTDVDAVILLPIGESLDVLHATLVELLASAGDPLRLESADDGHTRWLRIQPWQQDLKSIAAGKPVVADLLILPLSHLRPIAASHYSWGRTAFEGLCRCMFYTQASCFEGGPRLMQSIYGDFMRPAQRHATDSNGQQRNVLEEMDSELAREDGTAPTPDVPRHSSVQFSSSRVRRVQT